VSAPTLAPGTRAGLLSKYGLRGGPYTRSGLGQVGLRQLSLRNLVRGARGTIGFSLVTSVASNLYDYSVGANRGEGLSKEFAVSTGVDLIMSVGTGLAAAAGVALLTALVGVTLPVWGAIAAAAGLGLFIGIALDATGVGTALKRRVSEGVEAWPGIIQNAGVIAQSVGGRVADMVSSSARSVTSAAVRSVDNVSRRSREIAHSVANGANEVGEAARSLAGNAANAIQETARSAASAAQHIASSIGDAATQAVESARQFLGKLFRSGD